MRCKDILPGWKKINTTCSVGGMILICSCNQKPDVNAFIVNQEIKNEIFKNIAENHGYMHGFLETVQMNEHTMQMMQGNKIKGNIMMNGMMGNCNMMHSMMEQMITNSTKMMCTMQMVHQNGMISEECQHSCMEMMNHNGMMDRK